MSPAWDDGVVVVLVLSSSGPRRSAQSNPGGTCRYQIIVTYPATAPSLPAKAVRVVSLYVGWVDIQLVVNERFTPIWTA